MKQLNVIIFENSSLFRTLTDIFTPQNDREPVLSYFLVLYLNIKQKVVDNVGKALHKTLKQQKMYIYQQINSSQANHRSKVSFYFHTNEYK